MIKIDKSLNCLNLTRFIENIEFEIEWTDGGIEKTDQNLDVKPLESQEPSNKSISKIICSKMSYLNSIKARPVDLHY